MFWKIEATLNILATLIFFFLSTYAKVFGHYSWRNPAGLGHFSQFGAPTDHYGVIDHFGGVWCQ